MARIIFSPWASPYTYYIFNKPNYRIVSTSVGEVRSVPHNRLRTARKKYVVQDLCQVYSYWLNCTPTCSVAKLIL